jgi:hypothetical protein
MFEIIFDLQSLEQYYSYLLLFIILTSFCILTVGDCCPVQHSHTHSRSLRVPWTSDQAVTETST